MKKPRVFAYNRDSGEPWSFIGDIADPDARKSLASAVGEFAVAEIEGAGLADGEELTIALKVKHMTDDEVDALPEC